MDFHERLKNAMIPLCCTAVSAIIAYGASQYLTDVAAIVYVVLWMIPSLYLIMTVMGLLSFLDFGMSVIMCVVVVPVFALIVYLIVGMFVFFGISGIG